MSTFTSQQNPKEIPYSVDVLPIQESSVRKYEFRAHHKPKSIRVWKT